FPPATQWPECEHDSAAASRQSLPPAASSEGFIGDGASPKFLRQTFHGWALHSSAYTEWARECYDGHLSSESQPRVNRWKGLRDEKVWITHPAASSKISKDMSLS